MYCNGYIDASVRYLDPLSVLHYRLSCIDLGYNIIEGFIIDFESYFKETLCENLTDMLELLKETTESERDYVLRRKDSYERINQYGFDNKRIDYEEIWSDIKNLH